MSFFLPSRLIRLEYLIPEAEDEEYNKEAEQFQKEIDFAFFVVNFGYSKSEYEKLTRREIAFIKKAWENKIVLDTTMMNNAVSNAEYNVNRGKKQAKKLFPKSKVNKSDITLEDFNKIKGKEEKKGFGWFEKITGRRVNNE